MALTFAVGTAAMSSVSTRECASAAACHEDTVKLALTGVWLGQATVLVLGALSMGAEYGTGTVRTMLTSIPRRATVLASKAAVLATATGIAADTAILASLATAHWILSGNGFTPEAGYFLVSLTDTSALRAALGSFNPLPDPHSVSRTLCVPLWFPGFSGAAWPCAFTGVGSEPRGEGVDLGGVQVVEAGPLGGAGAPPTGSA
ncbi:hypothetical protein OG585_31130 [Streptomyces sp. NBC_01340]|uniref:hypothetical protein n=1 Tax=unclassified Streptomyces TaxID=2593676 RepID=UPI002254484C|nr:MULTISPECIES: hypothetical protein [unclassified Streptomyces]MCX4457030.1 hypothetical protein [Streptomyces sp. NBC_01719]MCX4496389.1 hypothetical protein [Streptomyces sp. NBC_01728]WSI41296.1 hypothetical protein OG585_31130 [Streptomyces sp. NBC_01340]